MADYTIVNLKEVEDRAASFGFAPEELYLVLGGSMRAKLDDEVVELDRRDP
jgi:hypothetical protein